MKRHKLAFLISHPIQYQTPLFKEMANHAEIDLTVYFCSKKGLEKSFDAEFNQEIQWNIPLLEGYKYKFLKNFSPGFSFPAFDQVNPGIIKELFKKRFDAIVLCGYTSFSHWFALLAAKISKTAVFLRTESALNQEKQKSRAKILIKRIILAPFFKMIQAFLYIGKENKSFYQFYSVPDSKLFFTPYAVDNQRWIGAFYRLREQKQKLKKDLRIGSDKLTILFVGKLIPKKRPLDLLKAYEKIGVKNKALIFAGEGVLRSEIESYVKKKGLKDVFLVGFKNQTELPRYYAMADIFVLPSERGETWGLVVNEAMCFKLPIIVSDLVGCASDLLKEGENGYVFPVGEVDKLSFYLEDLIKDKEKRRMFGEKSFQIIQHYSYKKDIEGILKAL